MCRDSTAERTFNPQREFVCQTGSPLKGLIRFSILVSQPRNLRVARIFALGSWDYLNPVRSQITNAQDGHIVSLG